MLLYPVGYLGLVVAPHSLAVLWALVLGAATTTFPMVLTLIGLRAATPEGTAALSSFTQSTGYLLAALGPFGVGVLHEASGGWTVPLVALAAAHRADARAGRVRRATRQVRRGPAGALTSLAGSSHGPHYCAGMSDEQTPPPAGDQPMPGPSRRPRGRPHPPVNPYETPAAPPPPPPAPADPAAPAAPVAQPPYGDPQAPPPPPAAPSYAQPGQPQYGVPVAEPEPSKAMAITALVAVAALLHPARSHPRRSWCWGAARTAATTARGWPSAPSSSRWSSSLGIAAGVGRPDPGRLGRVPLLPVEQLKTGECLNASNLTDDSEDFVEDISEVALRRAARRRGAGHQGADPGRRRGLRPASSTLCTDLITGGPSGDKVGPDIGYFGLTTDSEPNAGDKLVCMAYKIDGSKLDAPL